VKTLGQIETMLKRAEQFARNVLQDPQKADEFASMGANEYASRKGIQIRNPDTRGGLHERTSIEAMTKPELESLLDEVEDLIDAALDPRLSREQVIDRVMEASDLIGGEEEEPEPAETEEGDEAD
jgi:hypothetical protein